MGEPQLTPELVLEAYANGIFPMSDSAERSELFWVDPDPRGIIPIDRFHVPQKLRRVIRQHLFEIRCDSAFAAVMRGCAAPAPDRERTWINQPIIDLFTTLHHRGYAHSVEAWYEGQLVGGLYGIALNSAFFGESMFSRVTDASKVALVHLVAILRRNGFLLLDTQFVTPHLARFGAIEISRQEYRRRLAQALKTPARFQPLGGVDPVAVLQSCTQTS